MSATLRPLSTLSDQAIMVIDIGGTNAKFGYTVGDRPLDYRKRISSNSLKSGDAVAELATMVKTVIEDSGITPANIVAAIPGYIDSDLDKVLFAANVAGLEGRQVASELARLVGCPVYLERDSILALMGEIQAGAAQGCGHVLGIYFGTGIGAAFIHDGKPFRGSGWSLEIGLMPFMTEGRKLEGLREDCLEAYASGRALQLIADRFNTPIGDIFLTAESNPVLKEELQRFVLYQAFSVSTGIAMMSPATVLLGGGVLEMPGFPREQLLQLVDRYAPVSETGRQLDLRWCHHSWSATLHGAPSVVDEQRELVGAKFNSVGAVATR